MRRRVKILSGAQWAAFMAGQYAADTSYFIVKARMAIDASARKTFVDAAREAHHRMLRLIGITKGTK